LVDFSAAASCSSAQTLFRRFLKRAIKVSFLPTVLSFLHTSAIPAFLNTAFVDGNYVRREQVEGNPEKGYLGDKYRSEMHCSIEASSRRVKIYAVSSSAEGVRCVFEDSDIPGGRWLVYHKEGKGQLLHEHIYSTLYSKYNFETYNVQVDALVAWTVYIFKQLLDRQFYKITLNQGRCRTDKIFYDKIFY